MRLSLPLLFLICLLAGCATQAQQAPKAPKVERTKAKSKAKKSAVTQPSAEAAPVVVFRKTPCFGICPHYEAFIYADGRVRYEGFSNAPIEGKRELKLPVATVNTILAEARSIRFTELPDRYSLGATDMPSTSLSVSPVNGPIKTVTVEEGAPAELQNLLRYVEKQVVEALGVAADR